ncbi:MAG TPA: hypothetical protein VH044_20755 [Polyangiaceae bacterium]|jgi:uncharacterized membrane protein YeaQ/YmgE (transglycosylase-associated protein family)|nr:hypothetical protein [Polyangiaceae bacterium]
MNALDSVLGWMAIGSAASLAAMMWPFLRGGAGVIIKLLLGPLGAIAGALISRLMVPSESPAERLVFAAVGAVVALVVSQITWQRYARSKSLEHAPSIGR